MTEEIIIDDVNVSECEFLRRCIIPDNECCKIDDSLCCDVGNCHFKQRKRLEQENADLKKQIESQKGLINVGGKAQNEYLKEIAELKQKNERLITNSRLECLNCEYKYATEYKSALEEIEKLSENAYCLTNGTNKDMAEFAKTIMIKVNEVLNIVGKVR